MPSLDLSCEPIIVYANNTELSPGRIHGNWTVPSRMLLWCHGGEGQIEANGVRLPINDHQFYFLPWNHHVTYYPGQKTPLSLSGIHLIPDQPLGEPVYFAVPHRPEEIIRSDSPRRDAPIDGLEGVVFGQWQDHVTLSFLAEYIVHWYRNGVPAEDEARWLAKQLIHELRQALPMPIDVGMQYPERLQRILGYIWNHLHLPFAVSDLAVEGRCDTSTIQRLFQKYFHETPTRYIQKRRVEKAGYLLADTLYSVAEIGRMVGIKDPYYFSRLFRKIYGMTATQYRRHSASLTQEPTTNTVIAGTI